MAGLLGLVVLAPPAAAYRTGEASRFITDLAAEAVRVLGSDASRLEEREAALRLLLARHVDIPLVGRFVLGPYWRGLTEAEREAYLDAFRGYLLRTYSARLGGYAGERLVVLGERAAGEKDVVVASRVERPSGPPVAVEWRVRVVGGPLRIIDVAVEGVSLAITHRSEFASVIERQGFAALVETLRARASALPAIAGQAGP